MEAVMSYKWSVKFWRICSTREVLQCTDRDDDHRSPSPQRPLRQCGPGRAKLLDATWSVIASNLSCTAHEIVCNGLISEFSSASSSRILNRLRTSASFLGDISVTSREQTLLDGYPGARAFLPKKANPCCATRLRGAPWRDARAGVQGG